MAPQRTPTKRPVLALLLLLLLAWPFCGRAFLGLGPQKQRLVQRRAIAKGGKSPTCDEMWERMILPVAKVISDGGKQGSAFVISDTQNGTYALACHHVIRDSIKQTDRWDPVKKSSNKVERFLPVSVETFRYDEYGRHLQTITTSADIVAYSSYGDEWTFEGDLALLKLRVGVDIAPAALISEESFLREVRTLDEVIMVGCPQAAEVPLPTTGHVASLSEVRGGIGLVLSEIMGNPGSSGSAVYRWAEERQRYEVIAIHSMTDGRGSLTDLGRGNFLRLSIQAPEIHKFLKLHEFSHLVEPPDRPAKGTKTAKKAKKADTKGGSTKDGTKPAAKTKKTQE